MYDHKFRLFAVPENNVLTRTILNEAGLQDFDVFALYGAVEPGEAFDNHGQRVWCEFYKPALAHRHGRDLVIEDELEAAVLKSLQEVLRDSSHYLDRAELAAIDTAFISAPFTVQVFNPVNGFGPITQHDVYQTMVKKTDFIRPAIAVVNDPTAWRDWQRAQAPRAIAALPLFAAAESRERPVIEPAMEPEIEPMMQPAFA